MPLFYFILGVAGAVLIVISFKRKNLNESAYQKVKNKLENEILVSNNRGDWKKRQELNLNLLWLKTLEKLQHSNYWGKGHPNLISEISSEDIKFPHKWALNDIYCYPFAQEIISDFGKTIPDNDYHGIFKPESILPVPKSWIKKAIFYTVDYLNIKNPAYHIPDKETKAKNLNSIFYSLDSSYLDTGEINLPKSGIENYTVGSMIAERLPKSDDREEFILIDWRSDTDWLARGIHYADKEMYDSAFACYEKAKAINPKNTDLIPVTALTYFFQGKHYLNKDDKTLALENIRRAAALGNKEAVNWLSLYSES